MLPCIYIYIYARTLYFEESNVKSDWKLGKRKNENPII
jgi:hypothetical protein